MVFGEGLVSSNNVGVVVYFRVHSLLVWVGWVFVYERSEGEQFTKSAALKL